MMDSARKDREGVERGEKTWLHFKFRFPTFEKVVIISLILGKKNHICIWEKPIMAFIKVLTTIPVREISGEN